MVCASVTIPSTKNRLLKSSQRYQGLQLMRAILLGHNMVECILWENKARDQMYSLWPFYAQRLPLLTLLRWVPIACLVEDTTIQCISLSWLTGICLISTVCQAFSKLFTLACFTPVAIWRCCYSINLLQARKLNKDRKSPPKITCQVAGADVWLHTLKLFACCLCFCRIMLTERGTMHKKNVTD